MTKTSRQIELSAVNTIVDIFNNCERLSPYIANGDKEPTWDGFVYIKNLQGKITGRVPVQVKGKVVKTIPKTPTYSVTLTNLQNYKREGGILYFVVYQKGKERFPFYAKLAGVDLKGYIRDAKGRKSISIKLKPLINEGKLLEQEIINFSIDKRKQTSFAESPLLSLDDALKLGRTLTFSITGPQTKKEALEEISKTSVYLYTEIEEEGVKALYPVGDQSYRIVSASKIRQNVSINGRNYFKEFAVRLENEKLILIIGDFLTITINRAKNGIRRGKFNFTIDSTIISERVLQLRFLYDFYQFRSIKFGDQVIKIDAFSDNQKHKLIKEMHKWERGFSLFKKLHINDDIDTEKFTKEDFGTIELLEDAILDHKSVHQEHNISPITTADIGPYKILLFSRDQGKGNYKIQDFFDAIDDLAFAYDGGKNGKQKLVTSPFTVVFSRNDFLKLSNIDYSHMIDSYNFAAKYNPYITDRATNDMLQALLAYDETNCNDKELEHAIDLLDEWIMTNSKKNSNKYIHIVNHYQIIKRKRKFTNEEKQDLLSLLSKRLSNGMKCAIHLLLENYTMADYYFDKLSCKGKKGFLSFPIAHFFKENKA